jgi:hypothetical protein
VCYIDVQIISGLIERNIYSCGETMNVCEISKKME